MCLRLGPLSELEKISEEHRALDRVRHSFGELVLNGMCWKQVSDGHQDIGITVGAGEVTLACCMLRERSPSGCVSLSPNTSKACHSTIPEDFRLILYRRRCRKICRDALK